MKAADPVASSEIVWRVSQASNWPRSDEASRKIEVLAGPPVMAAEMLAKMPGPAGLIIRFERTGGGVTGVELVRAVRAMSFPSPPL